MDAAQKFTNNPWKVYEEETPSTTIRYDERSSGLQDCLQLHHLQLLRDSFTRERTRYIRPRGRVRAHNSGPPAGAMSLEQFRSVLTSATGDESWNGSIEELFNELDFFCDGCVVWEKLCSFVLQQMRQREDLSNVSKHTVLSSEPLIRHCLQNRQEPVTRIVEVSQPPPLRYITISKGGTLTVWNSCLHLLKSLDLYGDTGDEAGLGRRVRGWTTDAVYLPNVHKVAVVSMSRDLHLIDVSASSCCKEFHVSGLSHVATALCYWYNAEAPGEKCVLMWGDEKGAVNLLWFLQPLKCLFETPFSNQTGPQRVLLQEICGQTSFVSYHQIPKIHSEPINRIKYEPRSNLIATSSESATCSVIIMDLNQRCESYIWKIEKGVQCFDISWSLGLLVTAGLDPALRIWNRYVPSQPVAVLQGHRTTVVDVVIHQALEKIFSYCKNAVLKIWDIPSQLCVKTVPLKFPNIQTGRIPEQGHFPLLLSLSGAPALLLSCREYLALLRLQNPASGPGPNQAFSCSLYIPLLKQLVTACVDSSLVVWDVETGRKHLEVKNAHGHEEITALTTDPSQHRLISAAANGTIKVWSLLNGHTLHKLEAVSDTEVTGVICLHGDQLLAVGWSRLVAQYSVGDALKDMYVKADLSWRSGRLHSEDVLAVHHCPALRLLATGSYDGEIIVWTLDTQRPGSRLQRPHIGREYPPTDRLLFLQKRAEDKQRRTKAVLLSSQAGCVHWWSVCGHTHSHAQFYVPKRADERVKALNTNQDNSLLFTGDTTGSISVWDISQYGLSDGDELVTEQPPLLHTWRAHEGALVSLEVLEPSCELFLVSVSTDNTLRLWFRNGGCVGCFGEEQLWNLNDPSTYEFNRERPSSPREEEQDTTGIHQSETIRDLPGLSGWGQNPVGGTRAKISLGEGDHGQTDRRRAESLRRAVSSSFSAVQHKVALEEHVTTELQRMMIMKKNSRSNFNIDKSKLCRIGNECTPFQALKIVELKNLEDLPPRPWILSHSPSFSRVTELSSPLLSSDGSAPSGTVDSSPNGEH
ncbi:cilia- and flagella-associated protein 337 [Hoplias malabaricus]|uniref:cilia- and flagella-associated protein 337 n=1 Tax=Hoplias malabaricus TaxID=27720 RepID=UPI0034625B8E